MKVTLGKSTKKYPHKFKFKNYTTSSFGAVQPLFHQFMNKGDSLSLSSGQLVRLAPMPVPTLGDLKVINKFRFVEMNELYPYYDAFLSKRSVRSAERTFIPTKLPFVTNNSLWSLIFFGDRYLNTERTPTLGAVTCYKAWAGHPATTHILPNADDMSEGFTLALNSFVRGNLHPSFQADGKHYMFDITSSLSQHNCDFCIIDYPSTRSETQPHFPNIFCVKLNNAGRRIFNVLRGLGFSLDPTDSTELDLLPIFAFVKAYFDEYEPQRSINWHSTDAYNFLIKSSQSNYIDFSSYSNDPGQTDIDNIHLCELLHSVLYSLRNCFYTYENDWVSVHTPKALNDTPSETISSIAPNGLVRPNAVVSGVVSSLDSSGNNFLTQYSLDALRMLSRRQAKESLIGGKIYEYIKNKYGSGVADDMFSESHNIGSFISNCSVQDVLSSADTTFSAGSGERLGAYAGLGIGSGKYKLRFRAPNFGYFIALMSVVPESRYYQGNDPTLTALTREECPNPDYDALGYELTPRSSIYDNNGYAITPTDSELLTRGFGFIPRLSKWKYKKDIVNGCMRHRSVAASFDPYHLDRIVSRYNISGNFDVAQLGTFVPDASTAWRYVGKYAQLGNFNRIFYNAQEATALSVVDDNFIIDTAFNMTLHNCLKPMSESYQAKDEEIDNSVSSVSVE